MANVVVSTRPGHAAGWERTVRELSRVPGAGEHLAPRVASGRVAWLQTTMAALIGFQPEESVTTDAERVAVAAAWREEMDLGPPTT